MASHRPDPPEVDVSRCLHDLRNALNRIALSVECLRREATGESARFVAAIERALGEAGFQLDRLQSLKKVEHQSTSDA